MGGRARRVMGKVVAGRAGIGLLALEVAYGGIHISKRVWAAVFQQPIQLPITLSKNYTQWK